MPDLFHELTRPGALTDGAPVLEVRETHISWVFLTAEEAWKVKKPVALGFLDFSTLDARKRACEEEARLNARLSPDVYLGVVPLALEEGRVRANGRGPVVDWAVRMRRVPDACRADVLLRAHRLEAGVLERVAQRLAELHANAPCSPEALRHASPSVIAKNAADNFPPMAAFLREHDLGPLGEELERRQARFVQSHEGLFAARVRDGRVREGHGDLRLEHVYDEDHGKLTIVDCVEFDEALRVGDVCADVAFLSMDLAWHGRTDLAESFLAAYARATGDFDLYALVDFYETYRACVRAKVAALTARGETLSPGARDGAVTDARRYLTFAFAAERPLLLRPSVTIVGGVIASGKSTVADAIAQELTAPVVDADRTRKHMLGRPTLQHVNDGAWKGAYDPRFTEDVYAEVLRQARVVLDSGRPVVIDASFRTARMRGAARRLAMERQVPFRMIECQAPRDVCRARLRARASTQSVSDGRLEIFDAFANAFERVSEIPAAEHVVVDTEQSLAVTLKRVRQMVVTWPFGLTG